MWVLPLAALLLGAPAPAGTAAVPALLQPDDKELQARFIELEDEYEEARNEFYAELTKKWEAHQASAKEGEEFTFPDPIEPNFYARFNELAAEGHGGACAWCLTQHQHSGLEGQAARQDKLERTVMAIASDLDDETLQGLCYFLSGEARAPYPGSDVTPESQLGAKASFAFLDLIRASTDSDEVKGMTLYCRAEALEGEEATRWHQRAADEYGDTEIGQRCSGLIFAAQNLQIGQTAPDIVGKDHDGNDIRRSDFAGKVTVLDFWGFW